MIEQQVLCSSRLFYTWQMTPTKDNDKQENIPSPGLPKWLRALLIAIPLGALLGIPIPLINFLSERRDWGKTHESYSEFVSGYVSWGLQYSLIGICFVWLIFMVSSWLLRRRRLQKTTSHPVSAQPDHE